MPTAQAQAPSLGPFFAPSLMGCKAGVQPWAANSRLLAETK